MSLNLEQARFNMVEQQVRTWEVLDQRVLDVLRSVPREDFVPSRYRKMAFADLRLPIGEGEVMMKPLEEGRLLQSLNIESGQRVLEIGTGSGFLAACLAALGGRVKSLEIHASLAESARARLDRSGFSAVEVERADALNAALPEHAFDAVVLTASVAEVPNALLAAVATGGRLFVVRGQPPAMEAVCLTRLGGGRWHAESLFETDLPRLRGGEDRPTFDF